MKLFLLGISIILFAHKNKLLYVYIYEVYIQSSFSLKSSLCTALFSMLNTVSQYEILHK